MSLPILRLHGRQDWRAAVAGSKEFAAALAHLGLPTEPAPVAAARAPPQDPLWSGALDARPDVDAYDPA